MNPNEIHIKVLTLSDITTYIGNKNTDMLLFEYVRPPVDGESFEDAQRPIDPNDPNCPTDLGAWYILNLSVGIIKKLSPDTEDVNNPKPEDIVAENPGFFITISKEPPEIIMMPRVPQEHIEEVEDEGETPDPESPTEVFEPIDEPEQ